MSAPTTEAVTSVITHVVKQGRHDAYEEWLRHVMPAAAAYDGHQGVNVLRPAQGERRYTIALRFDTVAHLNAWLESGTRARLMEAVSHLLAEAENVDVHRGLDFWFPASDAPIAAPRWKQWLATVVALYPLTLVVPIVVGRLCDWLSIPAWPALRGLFVVAANVALLTFAVMPYWTRLLRRWLYRPKHAATPTAERQ